MEGLDTFADAGGDVTAGAKILIPCGEKFPSEAA
jgi:hypothetical protein